jgi:hypothetical protein
MPCVAQLTEHDQRCSMQVHVHAVSGGWTLGSGQGDAVTMKQEVAPSHAPDGTSPGEKAPGAAGTGSRAVGQVTLESPDMHPLASCVTRVQLHAPPVHWHSEYLNPAAPPPGQGVYPQKPQSASAEQEPRGADMG